MQVRPEFHRLREDFYRWRIRGVAVANNVHDLELDLAPKLNVDLKARPEHVQFEDEPGDLLSLMVRARETGFPQDVVVVP